MSDFNDKNRDAADRRSGKPDPIEMLLRASDRRPAVPPERTARVQAAVRAHWQDKVEGARRWRIRMMVGGGSALAAASLAAAFWMGVFSPVVVDVGRIEQVVDAAWSYGATDAAGSKVALRAGDRLIERTVIETEAGSRVAIHLQMGHSVRADAGTRLRLLSAHSLQLERGAVYVDSGTGPGATGTALEIVTPFGLIRDIGTQFEVRMDSTRLLLRVREGSVSLESSRETVNVSAGDEVRVSDTGEVVRRTLESFAPEWAWVGSITPMIDMQGKNLHEFLDWLARERGLHLQYATSDLATTARGTRLSGSVQGMTLDEALQSVLATSGLLHEVEAGRLRVYLDLEARR